jgi:hypothetical protein
MNKTMKVHAEWHDFRITRVRTRTRSNTYDLRSLIILA